MLALRSPRPQARTLWLRLLRGWKRLQTTAVAVTCLTASTRCGTTTQRHACISYVHSLFLPEHVMLSTLALVQTPPQLSHTRTLSHSRTHTHTLTHSLTHTHTLTHSHTHTLTHSHTHTHSHALTHTHTHSHTRYAYRCVRVWWLHHHSCSRCARPWLRPCLSPPSTHLQGYRTCCAMLRQRHTGVSTRTRGESTRPSLTEHRPAQNSRACWQRSALLFVFSWPVCSSSFFLLPSSFFLLPSSFFLLPSSFSL